MIENMKLILGIICGILYYAKMMLHVYIDKENGYPKKSIAGHCTNPLLYLPYYDKVTESTKGLKIYCNIIFGICMSLIIIIVILG